MPGADRADTGAGREGREPFTDKLVRIFGALTLIYSCYYLFWRWTETLNPDALAFSLILVLAETWGVFTFAGLLFTTWRLTDRPERPAPAGLDVAVFVTTYDEPISVIRRTVIAAREIRYPHRTYLLDDGRRAELATMAEELGVGYITRSTNEHAKAGNLNHALSVTNEAFVLQLDADHAPLPHILDRLLGYFDDERVAFVQSPQDFYNLDSFTHVVDEKGRRVWEEQRLFFSVIQPGKDYWNAAFFCGSCGVIRRAALEEIGGFSTQTITEDMETSMLLHGRGWRSVYVDESLAFGLSPGSLLPYQVQRLRWAQGAMQMLRKMNPLWQKGLTIAQRASYFFSVVHYFDGVQRFVFIMTPVLFFAAGILPLVAVEAEFLVRLFIYLFMMITSFELLARGHGYLWISERFQMARWPIYMRAVAGLFTRKPLRFNVTPKGDAGTPLRAYLPQLLIVVLTPLLLLWSVVASSAGWIDYGVDGWRSGAFVIGAGWLFWNAFFALQVVRMARSRRQAEDHPFREAVPIRFHLEGRTGLEARPGMALTHELGSTGFRFLSTTPLELMERLRVHLPLSTGDWELEGRVTERKPAERAGIRLYDHRVSFIELPLEAQLGIELHCLHHALPARTKELLHRPDLFQDFRLWFRERRREPRERVNLPAQLAVEEERGSGLHWHPAVLEELARHGLLVLTDAPVGAGARVRCQIPGAFLSIQGVVRHTRLVDTPRGSRWALGIESGEPIEVPGVPLPRRRRARSYGDLASEAGVG